MYTKYFNEAAPVVVGGGIGGLAAALACGSTLRTAGLRVLEQASALGEVGAGIQLGPNATRVLHQWGLEQGLKAVAVRVQRLQVRCARSAVVLGSLPLGAQALARYGAPYVTIARQDLHALLHRAVQAQGLTDMVLGARVSALESLQEAVQLRTQDGRELHAGCVLGADGVRSVVRSALVPDAAPQATGHVAFRAMLAQAALPAALRSMDVTAWLGPKFHAVQYPVRGGEWLNLVVIVHGQEPQGAAQWNHGDASAQAVFRTQLRAALTSACSELLALVEAVDDWRLWALYDRAPLRSASAMAQGRVALLGDAAHPMRPYLAQGAGMALEDAQQLAASLQQHASVPAALAHYAQLRWQRNARVQARALRNGQIFHLRGPLRWARDGALRLLGPRLLDMPWLYGYRI